MTAPRSSYQDQDKWNWSPVNYLTPEQQFWPRDYWSYRFSDLDSSSARCHTWLSQQAFDVGEAACQTFKQGRVNTHTSVKLHDKFWRLLSLIVSSCAPYIYCFNKDRRKNWVFSCSAWKEEMLNLNNFHHAGHAVSCMGYLSSSCVKVLSSFNIWNNQWYSYWFCLCTWYIALL